MGRALLSWWVLVMATLTTGRASVISAIQRDTCVLNCLTFTETLEDMQHYYSQFSDIKTEGQKRYMTSV